MRHVWIVSLVEIDTLLEARTIETIGFETKDAAIKWGDASLKALKQLAIKHRSRREYGYSLDKVGLHSVRNA